MLPTKDTLMDTNINKLVLYNLFYSILFYKTCKAPYLPLTYSKAP